MKPTKKNIQGAVGDPFLAETIFDLVADYGGDMSQKKYLASCLALSSRKYRELLEPFGITPGWMSVLKTEDAFSGVVFRNTLSLAAQVVQVVNEKVMELQTAQRERAAKPIPEFIKHPIFPGAAYEELFGVIHPEAYHRDARVVIAQQLRASAAMVLESGHVAIPDSKPFYHPGSAEARGASDFFKVVARRVEEGEPSVQKTIRAYEETIQGERAHARELLRHPLGEMGAKTTPSIADKMQREIIMSLENADYLEGRLEELTKRIARKSEGGK
jgi:hypothetical protein